LEKSSLQKISESLGNGFGWAVESIFRVLPWGLNLILAQLLTFLWFDVFRIRRKVIFDNLDIAFKNLSQAEKRRIARKSVQCTMRSFFDIMRIPSLNLNSPQVDQEWIAKNVIFHGLEHPRRFDRGVLFMSLHLGSGDIAAAIVSEVVRPISLITKRFKNKFVDQFWFSMRSKAKTRFIDPHVASNSFEILRALKEKRGVTFVVDQFMGMPFGVETPFFGKNTGTAYGLALFAMKTKAPVIPLYTRWDDLKKLHIYFDAPIDLSPYITEDIEVNKVLLTSHFNSILEKIISKYPEDWMWIHRRWKKFE
jgi:Kdo2-lipid IVA lauroyltransferase/acyltransferase